MRTEERGELREGGGGVFVLVVQVEVGGAVEPERPLRFPVDTAQHLRVRGPQVRIVCGAIALVLLPAMVRRRPFGFLGHDVSEEGGLAESLVRTQEVGARDGIAEDRRILTAAEPVAPQAAAAGGADRDDGSDALVTDGGVHHRVAAAGEYVQRTDAVGVDVLLGTEMADGALDVRGTQGGVLQEMGFAFTRALVGDLEGEGGEPCSVSRRE